MKNEIRQGNYVSITPHGKNDIIQLNEQEIENLYIFKNWDRIKPIPLTEEWLLKMGFKFFGGSGYKTEYSDLHWNFSLRNGFMPDIFFKHAIKADKIIGCNYVHQLQNLYHALTNNELTIKL